MRAALILIILSFAFNASAFDLRGIQNNNQGVKRFNEERLSESYNAYVRGLTDLPFQSEVHYNLGRTFFENKEYEKSYQESMIAAQYAGEDKLLKFMALFQAAASMAEQKKIDEALGLYQQALELQPDSVETKTNIELLVQQQQGGGQGEQQQQQQGEGEGEQEQPNDAPRTNQNPNQKKQPRPFKSDELSKKDVENILDELERQEEQIRAKFQREGSKDQPKDKDW